MRFGRRSASRGDARADPRPDDVHRRAPAAAIRDADRIVVMKNGRIREAGSREELPKRRGKFCQLRRLRP
jgi:hypothetical protein